MRRVRIPLAVLKFEEGTNEALVLLWIWEEFNKEGNLTGKLRVCVARDLVGTLLDFASSFW
jgi:predicted DNA-binding ribbon-helix-helix protein